jgi:hypothetical protein
MIEEPELKVRVQKLWLDWSDEATPRGSRPLCPAAKEVVSGFGRAGRRMAYRSRWSCR